MYPTFLGTPATGYVQQLGIYPLQGGYTSILLTEYVPRYIPLQGGYPGIPLTEHFYVHTCHRIIHPTFVGMIPDIACDVICL